jgi:hypothetical protein
MILKNCFILQSRSIEACSKEGKGNTLRKSVICLVIALTILSFSLCFVPTTLSLTQDIKIVSYNWYFDMIGFVDVVGEVQNIGASTIASVYLAGEITTSDGTKTESSVQVWVQDLLPQQKAPFYMPFYPQGSGQTPIILAVTDVQLAVVKADTTTDYQYQDLTITNQNYNIGTGADDKGVFWVTGTIKNTGTQTAQNIRVLGTFYNTAGNVVAVGGYTEPDGFVATSLAPSATTTFKFGAFDINQTGLSADEKIATYSLLVQAEKPILQGTGPKITPYPTGHPQPTGTATPKVTQTPDSGDNNGSTSNTINSSPPSWIYATTILILAVIIGAVIALRRRKSKTKQDIEDEEEKPKKIAKKPVAKPVKKKVGPKKVVPKKQRQSH